MLPVRPLRSTGVTPFPHYCGPLRLPARADPLVMHSLGSWSPVTLSPPCRISQVPRLIYPCALSPTTPEGPASACSLLPRRYQASSPLADWPPSLSVTRPKRVRLRYGSQVCFPGFHQTDCSASLRFSYMHERAIYMVNSFQFTRSARLSLVYQRRKENQGILLCASWRFLCVLCEKIRELVKAMPAGRQRSPHLTRSCAPP